MDKSAELTPADKEKLLAELDAAIQGFKAAETEVAKLADQKRLPEEEKESRTEMYKRTAEGFARQQKEAQALLDRLDGGVPSIPPYRPR